MRDRNEKFSKQHRCFFFPPKHSFTISANEVDTKDSIRSHREPLPAAAAGRTPPPPAGGAAGSDRVIFLPIRTVQNEMKVLNRDRREWSSAAGASKSSTREKPLQDRVTWPGRESRDSNWTLCSDLTVTSLIFLFFFLFHFRFFS